MKIKTRLQNTQCLAQVEDSYYTATPPLRKSKSDQKMTQSQITLNNTYKCAHINGPIFS